MPAGRTGWVLGGECPPAWHCFLCDLAYQVSAALRGFSSVIFASSSVSRAKKKKTFFFPTNKCVEEWKNHRENGLTKSPLFHCVLLVTGGSFSLLLT